MSVEALLDISVKSLVGKAGFGTVEPRRADLVRLPRHLKDRLRRLLLKRGGLVDPATLRALLHDRVSAVDLGECDGVGAEHLRQVSEACPALKVLDLSDTLVTVDARDAARLPPRLVVLHMRRSRVDDAALTALTERCPMLEELDLGYCSSVGDDGVASLGSCCRRLTSLSLAHTAVTDLGLRALVSSSPGGGPLTLRELRIDGCLKVEDQGVSVVLSGCPSLRIFIFHNCPRVTERAREEVEAYLQERREAGGGGDGGDGARGGGGSIKQLMWTVY